MKSYQKVVKNFWVNFHNFLRCVNGQYPQKFCKKQFVFLYNLKVLVITYFAALYSGVIAILSMHLPVLLCTVDMATHITKPFTLPDVLMLVTKSLTCN